MVETVRWGIASTGKIAARMAEALASIPDAEIVAVGSRSHESAQEFAERFDIPHAHGSYADLYTDDDVDIVYVASPHSRHGEMTIAALEAGRHVLCEKPFAVNAAQAREMVAAAERCDRFLMEAMWSWFIPAVVEIRDRVRAGAIGEVRAIEANFGIRTLDERGRHRRIDLAGGALLDLGLYPLGFMRFLLGEPTEVRSLGTVGPTGVDTNLAGVAAFPGGALGLYHTTIDAQSALDAVVVGTEGRIEVDTPFFFTSSFTVIREGVDPERVELPNRGLAHEAEHAMERIRAGHRESDVVPLTTSVVTMELLDRIRADVGVVYPEDAVSDAAG